MNVGSKVVVESKFVPDYNGLTGEIVATSSHPADPTMPEQFKVRADSTPENLVLLEGIGSPYVNLEKPWDFWFVLPELKES